MGCAGQEFLDSSGTVSAAAASSTSFLVKHLKCRKGYLVCLDSANIKDLLKLETGNKGRRREGRGENQFWASLVMEVRNKDSRPQKGLQRGVWGFVCV